MDVTVAMATLVWFHSFHLYTDPDQSTEKKARNQDLRSILRIKTLGSRLGSVAHPALLGSKLNHRNQLVAKLLLTSQVYC